MDRLKHWILVGKTPIEVDVYEWAAWIERSGHIIYQTTIGETRVSTAFLGIDHSHDPLAWAGVMPPVLFETMVFGGPLDHHQERYMSYDQAMAGHRRLVRKVRRLPR